MDSLRRNKRDLAWCLRSEPLIAVDDAAIDASCPADIVLPFPPDPHRFRLGQHFERLLETFLEASPTYELIAANLQVHETEATTSRTIGEFDFLVAHDGQVEHWEAAIKFYLGVADRLAANHWFGPNTEDRLDIKVDHLYNHQLVLGDDPAAQRLLAQRGVTIAARRCFMKGRLFHPWHEFHAGIRTAPLSVNPSHESGWWITFDELNQTCAELGLRYVYLPKALWLSPLKAEDIETPLSFWELAEFLESPEIEQATHVAIVTESGEVSRGFVVKDQWLTRVNALMGVRG